MGLGWWPYLQALDLPDELEKRTLLRLQARNQLVVDGHTRRLVLDRDE
eukprot:COSAG01_NODE_3710_length_5770_cov_10.433962_2_plen_48_part_00